MSYNSEPDGQLTLLELRDAPVPPRRRSRFKPEADLIAIPFLYLDLSPDHVDLFGNFTPPIGRESRPSTPGLRRGSRSGRFSQKYWRKIQRKNIICPKPPAWESCSVRRNEVSLCHLSSSRH